MKIDGSRMCESEILTVFHFGGRFDWDNGNPVYIGGDEKMLYLRSSLTFHELFEKILEVTKWVLQEDNITIKYLHQNGHVRSLVRVRSDDDVHVMFRASGCLTGSVYLYLHKFSDNKLEPCQPTSRSRKRERVETKNSSTLPLQQKRNFDKLIFDSNQIDRSSNWEKPNEASPLIASIQRHNVLPMSRTNLCARTLPHQYFGLSHMYPSVDLEDDEDAHFTIGTDEGGTTVSIEDHEDVFLSNGRPSPLRQEAMQNVPPPHIIREKEPVKIVRDKNPSNVVSDEEPSNVSKENEPSNVARDTEASPVLKAAIPSNLAKDIKILDTLVAVEDLIGIPPAEGSSREMWKGRVFQSRDAFRSTLSKFALYSNFAFKPIRTARWEVTAKCIDGSCPWRIHASVIESGPQFQVRTYNAKHTCSRPLSEVAHRQATSRLISEFIKERLRQHPDYRPKEIMSDWQIEFGSQITYRKAHIAKEIAMHDIRGSYEESYAILPDYILELKRTNPGTYTKLWWEDDDSFQRFFVAFGACIRSFKSVFRPLIALDGSHLRGKYPGSLLIAVSQDGDHGLFPIAFAVVESECRETWSWFLANLDLALEGVQNLTILSDRMKGIALAVRDVLPNAKHCYCCKHLASNIQGKFKNEGIVVKFWCAARSYRLCEYERYMAEIRDVDQGAYDYIAAVGKEHWANAFIDGRRYDMLTTNIAESTNSLFKETRELPITQLIESIRAKLMEFFQVRREKSQSMLPSVTPYVDKILHKETEISRRLEARQAGVHEFQVLSGEYTDIVHLDKKTCTCRQWDLTGIPCAHAVSAIKLRRYNPYDFCEHWFSTEMYRHAYNDIIHGTRDRLQWDQMSGQRILPPHARRQPGRPRKNRIRTEDRLRRQVTCSHCKIRGHNRQTCRNPPA